MHPSRSARLHQAVALVGVMLVSASAAARTLAFDSVVTSTPWTYAGCRAERYAIVLQRLKVSSPPCDVSGDCCREEVYPDQVLQSSTSLANVLVQDSVAVGKFADESVDPNRRDFRAFTPTIREGRIQAPIEEPPGSRRSAPGGWGPAVSAASARAASSAAARGP